MDERLDELFDSPKFKTYSHVGISAPRDGNLTFRLFDPHSLSICFAEERVDLKLCRIEMRALAAAIDAAYKSLNAGRIVRLDG